jgi:TRAP-type transport system periplasmic protein
VVSLTTWNRLTSDQKAAIEDAAAISDAYFETVERDLERRMVTALRSAGITIRSMSRADYIAWLQLAQRTAWVEYTRINPRAQELLFKTVRTFLVGLGDKDTLVDTIFGDDQKK